MEAGEILAYLAGVIDSDGYLKVNRSFRTQGKDYPYYSITVGVQQLEPGEAIKLFAATFDGEMARPWILPSGRIISRCELHGRKAEAAIKRLVPYLLVKKEQALLLLRIPGLKLGAFERFETCHDEMEKVLQAVLALHDGTWTGGTETLPLDPLLPGLEQLNFPALSWSRNEVLAYLAGVIDSDGNLRITRQPVRGMLGPHYRVNIRASQVIPSPAMHLLAKTFGGNVTIKRSKRPHQRDLACWGQWDRTAIHTLRALFPHLRIKVREAYLLLELRRLKADGKKGLTYWNHRTRGEILHRMPKRCYTSEQVVQFDKVYWALRALHKGEPIGPNEGSLASAPAAGVPEAAP